MNQTPTAKKPNAINAILLTGFIAGTLDAAAASINFYARTGNSPIKVWRFVASGVFGKTAYADPDGLLMPALGLLFHFCLAFSFTIFFFLIYPKIKLLAKNIFVTGILYGFLVWMLMNKIVLPLSNTAKLSPRTGPTILGVPTQTLLQISFILFCIGLPIAFLTARFYRRKELIPGTSWSPGTQ
jgi:hypothetical protein